MNKFTISMVIMLAVLFCAVSCSKNAGPPDYSSYVNLQVGNKWTYIIETKITNSKQDFISPSPGQEKVNAPYEETVKVTSVEDVDGIRCFVRERDMGMEMNPKEYFEVNPELGVFLHKQGYFVRDQKTAKLKYAVVKISPPQTVIKFPLEPGKNWVSRMGSDKNVSQAVFIVKEFENVETPAGKFSALKVESQGGLSGGGEFKAFQWYAKNVGLVKEVQEVTTREGKIESSIVLKEYGSNKK